MGCGASSSADVLLAGKFVLLSDEDAIKKLEEIKVSHPGNRAAKHFSKDYYNSLSDDNKEALMQCLRSGTYNPDSGVGCYAMRPEDYDELRGFFAPLIADYHGVPIGTKHHTDWTAELNLDIAALGLGPSSARVRVGRNLANFPLPGNMSKEQRCEMEEVMSVAYKALAEKTMPNGKKFGGRYYSLTPGRADSISDKEYQGLIDEHLMFKDMSNDLYLNTAGISDDWPHGRGTYISDDRRVSIWCNEEDHLRVTVLMQTTVLNEPFDLLFYTLEALASCDGVDFKCSDEFGNVTSCPSNLGTGMRASVMCCLPHLTADATTDKASKIAKPFGLSVRGTGGEHTPVKGHMVDISPSARFGVTEGEILNRLYKGIQAMMEQEKLLAAESPADEEEEEEEEEVKEITSSPMTGEDAIKRLEELKVSHPNNLAAKHFDINYYNTLSDDLKDILIQCVRSGTHNVNSNVGCYAMRPEDYDELRGFFAPLIADYHGVPVGTKQVSEWTAADLDIAALGLGPSSARVRVGRNLANYPLPGGLVKEQRIQLEQDMSVAFKALAEKTMPNGEKFGGRYYSLTPGREDSISEKEYQGLIDEHLMFKDMSNDKYLKVAGIADDWPFGRGTYINDDRTVSIWVNEEDHLRVTVLKQTTKLNEPFDLLFYTLEALVNCDGVDFKCSDEFGFVTSCPSNLGTGMRASVMCCLPNLTADETTDKASKIAKPFGLSVRGTGGEHTPVVGHMVDISPSARFGVTEGEIMNRLYKGIEAMMAQENAA